MNGMEWNGYNKTLYVKYYNNYNCFNSVVYAIRRVSRVGILE